MANQSNYREPRALPIKESTQIGEARRHAMQLAGAIGMSETTAGKIGIIVNELATNLIKHGGGGEMIVRALATTCADSTDASGLEIMCIDHGPGITNVAAAMNDGYSTTGTSGNGLGAVRRLVSDFDLFSSPNRGTVIVARLAVEQSPTQPPSTPPHMTFGAVSLPIASEKVCGDAWGVLDTHSNRSVICVVDGLGHGTFAADAAQIAMRTFQKNSAEPSHAIVNAIHGALRSTRGAAVAVAEIRPNAGELRFTGIGNISAVIVDGTTMRSMVSHNGIAGAQVRRLQEFVYPWTAASRIFMHSDGLGSRWKLDQYPGLAARHPATIAGVLYRDHRRLADDVTILIAGASNKMSTTPREMHA